MPSHTERGPTQTNISVQVTAFHETPQSRHHFSLPHMCTLHQQLAHRLPECAMSSCPSAVSASSAPLSPAMSVLSPTFLPQSGPADLQKCTWCYSVVAQPAQELHFTVQPVETHDFCTGISSSWEVTLPQPSTCFINMVMICCSSIVDNTHILH